jgi:hypothetical protein
MSTDETSLQIKWASSSEKSSRKLSSHSLGIRRTSKVTIARYVSFIRQPRPMGLIAFGAIFFRLRVSSIIIRSTGRSEANYGEHFLRLIHGLEKFWIMYNTTILRQNLYRMRDLLCLSSCTVTMFVGLNEKLLDLLKLLVITILYDSVEFNP